MLYIIQYKTLFINTGEITIGPNTYDDEYDDYVDTGK